MSSLLTHPLMPTSRFSPVKDQQVIVLCDSAAITAGDISGVLSALKSLSSDPNAEVNVTVEIQVNFPSGASDQTKRAVTENAKTLNFKNADWE
ncbi:MAG: hypothetical protein Q7J38_05520 [Gallionella sp.]|nr:hypothetical protein [Gallionella sp.]